jgi:cyclopropane-fatty-acyl-phospholipid synthase
MSGTPDQIDRPVARITVGEAITRLMPDGVPFRFTAYDGSSAGHEDSPIHVHLENRRGLSYLLTAPGDLGVARAYVSGDISMSGVPFGDPYPILMTMQHEAGIRMPAPVEALKLVHGLGWSTLKPPPPPPEEALPRWRRALEGLRHSKARDAEAIHHHYDVSNRFYELILGPSMTYTCAAFAQEDSTLEEAQFAKYDLVCRKLGLKPGMRLLDVGSGWGGMVRHAATHYGVEVVGVTLSREQAAWAQDAIKRDGLDHVAEVRFGDYRDVPDTGFDAVSSIGLTEHIGISNYPSYFTFLSDKLVPGGRLLNHCITRPTNRTTDTGLFIDRYIFPDGELTGAGRIITTMQDLGLEVRHEENLREHYALTLKGWSANLVAHWDECVAEVGIGTAKVWGIYLAGSRRAFERNELQLHQVLAVKPDADGDAHFPLRPDWPA